jgi:hypothetical protein
MEQSGGEPHIADVTLFGLGGGSGNIKGFNLLTGNFIDYWDGKIGDVKEWRQKLKKSNRSCPEYNV